MSGGEVLVLDASGLRCPAPVIRLARLAKDSPPGTRIAVLATDPAARLDIPAWARMRGHELVGIEPEASCPGGEPPTSWTITVRLAGAAG
ncbi:sulfurtransferase TusA family protein [Cellulomonas hominis]